MLLDEIIQNIDLKTKFDSIAHFSISAVELCQPFILMTYAARFNCCGETRIRIRILKRPFNKFVMLGQNFETTICKFSFNFCDGIQIKVSLL